MAKNDHRKQGMRGKENWMLCLRTSLKTFVDIAMHGSASHERRQSDVYKSIKTLDEQAEDLKLKGFVVSRSGLYLRLLPKRSSSLEGQRHVSTVPVKLIKAQNDHHAKHIDGFFSHLKFKKKMNSSINNINLNTDLSINLTNFINFNHNLFFFLFLWTKIGKQFRGDNAYCGGGFWPRILVRKRRSIKHKSS
jgi:hypothetical protein